MNTILHQGAADVPFVETDIVLDEEEDLIWQVGWPQCSSEVNIL